MVIEMLNRQIKTGFVLFKEQKSQYTQINNLFIDHFLEQADGEYVKVYLLLIRLNSEGGRKIGIDDIANKLEISTKKVIRAFEYWHREGLINIEYSRTGDPVQLEVIEDIGSVIDSGNVNKKNIYDDTYNIVKSTDSMNIDYDEKIVVSNAEDKAIKDRQFPKFEDVEFSMDELGSLSRNEDLRLLVQQYECYMNKILSSKEQSFIIYAYKILGFDIPLIEYLIEQCISTNHTSVNYMIHVALDWADHNIKTIDDAKKYREMYKKEIYEIMNNLGLESKITPAHKEQFDLWLSKFNIDIIIEACKQTIKKIGKGNINYVDAILKAWEKKGIATIDEAKKDIDDYANVQTKANSIKKSGSTIKSGIYKYNRREIDYDAELYRVMARNLNEAR